MTSYSLCLIKIKSIFFKLKFPVITWWYLELAYGISPQFQWPKQVTWPNPMSVRWGNHDLTKRAVNKGNSYTICHRAIPSEATAAVPRLGLLLL